MYEVKLENLQKVVRRHGNQIHDLSTLDFDMDIGRDLANTSNKNVELNTSTPGNLSAPQPRYPSCDSSAPNRYGTYICY